MENFLEEAKSASQIAATLPSATKNRILREMAEALEAHTERIINANKHDLGYAYDKELPEAMIDRLALDQKRISAMADSLREIAALKEPVGRVLEGWQAESGIVIHKVAIPIGVIGIIYESRPNVTSDTAGLCFKSGNVCVLKGGKEAEYSNREIAGVLREVLQKNGLPEALVSLLPDSSREGVAQLIKMDRYVDLIIPRGGEGLIRYVSENATVPVVKHDKGLCHTYIDKDADIEKALKICKNAKCRRPGICNAMETLLVDKAIAKEVLPKIKEIYQSCGTELRGCTLTRQIIETKEATEEDFDTEYLANILSICIVEGVDEAITHIRRYGSGHSEAIVTENYTTGETFLNAVDAACVYINASTQFTDGGEFGFGAEVGISTNKLHARGPMGINDLTTYKYKIYGNGQIRA